MTRRLASAMPICLSILLWHSATADAQTPRGAYPGGTPVIRGVRSMSGSRSPRTRSLRQTAAASTAGPATVPPPRPIGVRSYHSGGSWGPGMYGGAVADGTRATCRSGRGHCGGLGCRGCLGCRSGDQWPRMYKPGHRPTHRHWSVYEQPKNLVYPPTQVPGSVVQYPYYTLKGPDDFFLK